MLRSALTYMGKQIVKRLPRQLSKFQTDSNIFKRLNSIFEGSDYISEFKGLNRSQKRSSSKKKIQDTQNKAKKISCKRLKSTKKKIFNSMWDVPAEKRKKLKYKWKYPDCEPKNKSQFPRFDNLYYESSIWNRKYRKTWQDCPCIIKRKKRFAYPMDSDNWKLSHRRTRRDVMKLGQKSFRKICTKPSKCPRLAMPFCRPARNQAGCTKGRSKRICKKRPTPLPSFSEYRRCRKRFRKTHCICLSKPALCDLFLLQKKFRKTNH